MEHGMVVKKPSMRMITRGFINCAPRTWARTYQESITMNEPNEKISKAQNDLHDFKNKKDLKHILCTIYYIISLVLFFSYLYISSGRTCSLLVGTALCAASTCMYSFMFYESSAHGLSPKKKIYLYLRTMAMA